MTTKGKLLTQTTKKTEVQRPKVIQQPKKNLETIHTGKNNKQMEQKYTKDDTRPCRSNLTLPG